MDHVLQRNRQKAISQALDLTIEEAGKLRHSQVFSCAVGPDMSDIATDDEYQNSHATGALVLRHHLCWRHRDLDGVMAYYHPDIQ